MLENPESAKIGTAEAVSMGKEAGPHSSSKDSRVVVALTPREAIEFIVKLATDDDFRRELESAPEETLARHHVYVAPGTLPDIGKLPSKKTCQDILKNLGTGQPFVLPLIPYRTPPCPPFLVLLPLALLSE